MSGCLGVPSMSRLSEEAPALQVAGATANYREGGGASQRAISCQE